MKYVRVLLFCLCFGFLFFAASVTAQAQTLQAGKTYLFSNQDSQSNVYVSFTGSGLVQYDYVMKDKTGAVIDFGSASGRFQVRNGGSTAITLTGRTSATASYNTAKISVKEVGGEALWRQTLAQHETVTFTGLNPSRALNIAIDNTGRTTFARYDLVITDKAGQVTYYDDDNVFTTLTVPQEGAVTLTALSADGLRLMIPAEWLGSDMTITTEANPALYYHTVTAGATVTLSNLDPFNPCVVNADKELPFSYITKGADGRVTDYSHDAQSAVITVAADSTQVITSNATNGTSVTFYFPYAWLNDTLRVTAGGMGMLVSFTVEAGESLTFNNKSGEMPYTFVGNAADPDTVIDYVYSNGDDIRYSNEVVFRQMTVEPGYTWTFTVKSGFPLTLWMPAEWLYRDMAVQGQSTAALSAHTIAAGQTITVYNTDLYNLYTLAVQSGLSIQGAAIVYDYMLTDDTGVFYQTAATKNELTLTPGAVLTLTADKAGPLVVWFPAAWDSVLTVDSAPQPALDSFALALGKTVLIENQSTEPYLLSMESASVTPLQKPTLDYVAKNNEGEIAAFGSTDADGSFTLYPGESMALTNTDRHTVTFVYPKAWLAEGLTFAESDEAVLRTMTINEYESLDIVNRDKKYNRYVLLRNATDARLGVQTQAWGYGFLARNDRGVITDYGVTSSETVRLSTGGKITIMPNKGMALTVYYPAEWDHSMITLALAEEAPLYRFVLAPDQRIVFDNNTRLDYTVQNSSLQAEGRYYVRVGNDISQITTDEVAETGVINLPAYTRITITAAKGYDLTLWMPLEWAKKVISGVQ